MIINKGSKGRWPRIRLEMKDRDIVDRVAKLCGGGNVRTITRPNPKWNDTYAFQVAKAERVRAILIQIHPWMSNRRAKLIEEMILVLDG